MLGRPDFRRMQAELANAGFGLMFGGGIILLFIILMLVQDGPVIAPALIGGGLAGLIFTLLVPANAARVGYRFARLPKELSPHEQELRALVDRLRKPWIMIVANIPYFAGLVGYTLESHQALVTSEIGSQMAVGLFSTLYVAGFSWGVQFLQVLWHLRRESWANRDR